MAVKVRHHKGAWWVFIDHHGKRKAKRIGASKRAAETVAEKIQAKLALGQFEIQDEQPKRPFDTYFRNWLDTYVKAHCKERTYDLYESVFRLYLRPAFGQKDMPAITREEVKALAYGLLVQGKSRGYVASVIVPLRELFARAIEDGHTDQNPCSKILRKAHIEDSEHQQSVSFLTREELGVLLRTCQEHFPAYYPLVSLLARTGLRIGEAFGLQWGDIDFQGRFLTVQRTYSHQRVTTPKSGKSRRVDMSQQLTDTLKAVLVERKKETLQKGWGDVPPWVFISQDRTPLDHSHFHTRVWQKLLARAGLRSLRPHALRHTFASLLIQNGESLAYVKEQLGHHSIQMTVDRYGHLVPGGNRQAVDKLDGLENETVRNPRATSAEDTVLRHR